MVIKTVIGDLFTSEETAEMLGISVRTLYNKAADGTAPKRYRVGRFSGYKEEDIRAHILATGK